ncbi:hypothetical protein TDB9533_03096 [Thalassocella blandensis]|nr:hypothetical protein TDB9533_03096 [Thalassocella blandensis]
MQNRSKSRVKVINIGLHLNVRPSLSGIALQRVLDTDNSIKITNNIQKQNRYAWKECMRKKIKLVITSFVVMLIANLCLADDGVQDTGISPGGEVESSESIRQNIEIVIQEREKRLEQLLEEYRQSLTLADQRKSQLSEVADRVQAEKAAWKKIHDDILYAFEDESFLPGSQNFRVLRKEVRDRIAASNLRVSSKQAFWDYYLAGEFEITVNDAEVNLNERDNDPQQIKALIAQIHQLQSQFQNISKTIKDREQSQILTNIQWENTYRQELFSIRGLLVHEIIQGNAFALNNMDPLLIELNSLAATTRYYIWREQWLKDYKAKTKRLLTFSVIRQIFKLVLLAFLIYWLFKNRKKILTNIQSWAIKNLKGTRFFKTSLIVTQLFKELYVFLIILLVGELCINILVRLGFGYAAILKPSLHYIIIFLLVNGVINFLSPRISQRELRQSRNAQEVSAMETVFELLPKLYLGYWLIVSIANSLISASLQESLLYFYLSKLIAFVFLVALFVCIALDRERWRMINIKATHSKFWNSLTERSQGRVWEPLVLLAGGGLGVYRVAWHFLMEQLNEMEMTKRFQAMISRAILERQYRKSTLVLDQSWFPQPYWEAFDFLNPAQKQWYVTRDDAEQTLADYFEDWKKHQVGQRILLCGDRGIGKSEIISQFLRANALQAKSASLMNGDTDVEKICQRLSKTILDKKLVDGAQLVEELKQMPPSVITLENIENSMLRKVGGFDGFAFLLDVLLQTSEKHFWILTCTSYAWTIVKQAVIGSQSFTDVLNIKGMDEELLKKMLLNRHFDTNPKAPDFSHLNLSQEKKAHYLEQKRSLSEQEIEEKNTALYFRILWDYTKGNPRQALYFWKSSLVWDNGNTKVHLFEVPEQRVLEGLQDTTLMLLAALIEHNGLNLDGLASVMNTSDIMVRRRIQELAPYNMVFSLTQDGRTSWHVESFWSRAVENYLEKRQFLFRGQKL